MPDPLEIRVLEQHWLADDPGHEDKCSHGRLFIAIAGHQVSDTDQEDYGISTSALALLRTLESDFLPQPGGERLIRHGCGAILMMNCPVGVDWSVRHESGVVHLDDAVTYTTTSESNGVAHPAAIASLPLAEYRAVVLGLASDVLDFFSSQPPREFTDSFDQEDYDRFWAEYRAICDRQRDR